MDSFQAPSPVQFATPSGLVLAGDVSGHGPVTVVLSHGGGQTRHAWEGVRRALLTGGYCVLRYDLRGHSDSAWAKDGDYFLPALADDLAAVVATVDQPVAVVGASIGGLSAFYAMGRAERPLASALVLLDIVLRPSPTGTERIRRFMEGAPDGFATLDDAAEAVAAYQPDRPRPRSSSGLRRNLRQGEDGRWRWHWDPRFLAQADALDDRARMLVSVASRVGEPVLLLRGEHSDVVGDAGLDEMQALVPNLTIQTIAKAGHMIAGVANDPFAPAIMAFLAGVPTIADGLSKHIV